MQSALKRHPQSEGAEALRIAVNANRSPDGVLTLRYRLSGAVDEVRVAPAGPSERADELWRTTCFEAFIAAPGGGYYELNFSPSSRWAAYRFEGYRAGMAPVEPLAAPTIEGGADGDGYVLCAALAAGGLAGLSTPDPWRLGVSAVIEDTAGRKSYWALVHPDGKPDFHHADGFACEL